MRVSAREVSPSCFLIGIKRNSVRLEYVKNLIKFASCFAVNAIRRKGGLALLWKHESQVQLIDYSQWHIMVQVEDDLHEGLWTLTRFYSESVTNKQMGAWKLLENLKLSLPLADHG